MQESEDKLKKHKSLSKNGQMLALMLSAQNDEVEDCLNILASAMITLVAGSVDDQKMNEDDTLLIEPLVKGSLFTNIAEEYDIKLFYEVTVHKASGKLQ